MVVFSRSRRTVVRRRLTLTLRGWIVALAMVLAAGNIPTGIAQPHDNATDAPDLNAIQREFQRVVDHVAPSVVGIRAQRRYYTPLDETEADLDAFEQRVVVNGSGTIVQDGLILTNEHVVQAASEIEILFHDGLHETATLVASDPRSDLAILKVERRGLPSVAPCDWDTVTRGQWTIALGNPFGLGGDGQLSVSVGIVSNLGRQLPGLGEVDDRFYHDMIQTTAPINPGNSGGPLFNIHGEFIGVITAMHTRAPADEGIGFAIPMTSSRWRIVRQLCTGRTIDYGYIGLTVRVLNEDEVDRYGQVNGVVIERVEPDGPADQAGLQVGDVLFELGDRMIRGPAHMAELVGLAPIDREVTVRLRRNGTPLQVRITVEQREISRVSWMRGGAVIWRGMRLADLTEDARQLLRLSPLAHGIVVIDVTPRTPAERAGFEIGQVIEAVEGQRIANTTDFLTLVRGERQSIELRIRNVGGRVVRP